MCLDERVWIGVNSGLRMSDAAKVGCGQKLRPNETWKVRVAKIKWAVI